MRLNEAINRKVWRREARVTVGELGFRTRDGFTLTELLIVSSLVAIITGGLMLALFSGKASFVASDAATFVQQQSRQAFDSMVRELREAGNVGTTSVPHGGDPNSIQLNFQIVRGYNSEAGCTGVCWGSDLALGGWVHYTIIGVAGNGRQLVRCANTDQTTAITALGTNCRVLANSVAHPNAGSLDLFAFSGNNVIVNLEIKYLNSALPDGGSRSSGVLTSQVRLRNA